MNRKILNPIVYTILFSALAFCITMLIRNSIIYDIRGEAIEVFYDIKNENSPYTRGIDFDDYGTYSDMNYDFKGWSFEYFYPNLKKIDRAALRREAIK